MGSCPQNCVSRPGGGSEEFSRNSSKSPGQLVDVLLIGWWGGNQQSASSAFWVHRVWGLRACGQHAVNFSHLEGVSVSAKQLEDITCVSFEGGPTTCAKAALLFLDCPSLVSASPPFPD